MNVAIVGAGSQGRIVSELLRAADAATEIVFVDDDRELWGSAVAGVPVRGGIDCLPALIAEDAGFVLAIGRPALRLERAEQIAKLGGRFINAIHPASVAMPSAALGRGCMVHPGAYIGTNARLGDHVLVNTAAVVEHDTTVADGASINPGARVGGRVDIGRAVFVGIGAIICPRLEIGAGSVIAAGAMVTSDVPEAVFVAGCPARMLARVDSDFDWSKLL